MAMWGWRPYVPVAERRRRATREMEKRRKKGHAVSPVVLKGRKIVTTFWGQAWCDNLERYSDFANRLPRGRTYVRNGSVVDLRLRQSGLVGIGEAIHGIRQAAGGAAPRRVRFAARAGAALHSAPAEDR